MKVIGYARISRAMDDSSSMEKQREIITTAARTRGWDLVSIAEDEDVSATKSRLNRPGLTQVRETVACGLADAVLVWRLDRLARSVVDMSTLLDEGLQIVSATEPLDTTSPLGRTMIEILQVFAGLESRTTGERAKATKAFLKGRRRWGGGPRPYGYRPVKAEDGIGKILIVVPDEAEVIRRVFGEILDGASVNGLARSLNAEGIPTAKGGLWTSASVLNIARALHVSGFLTESTPEGTRLRRPVVDEGGEPVVAWEPIVAADTARLVRERVTPDALDEARSASTKAGRSAQRRLLEGLALCTCGVPLIRRTRKGVAFYGCKGVASGPHVLAEAEKTEIEAEAQFLSKFAGQEVVEVVRSRPLSAAKIDVERALAAATAEITKTSTPDLPALFARIADLTSERERLDASEGAVASVRTFTPYGTAWTGWTTNERREHLAALDVVVRIHAAKRRGSWDASRVDLTTQHDYLAGQNDPGDGESRGPGRAAS